MLEAETGFERPVYAQKLFLQATENTKIALDKQHLLIGMEAKKKPRACCMCLAISFILWVIKLRKE